MPGAGHLFEEPGTLDQVVGLARAWFIPHLVKGAEPMHPDDLNFRDRADAGRQLVPHLMAYATRNPVILALPRGGVPVAFEVARALRASLDLIFVRKIGAPAMRNSVWAQSWTEPIRRSCSTRRPLAASKCRQVTSRETQRQLKEIERRREHYLAGRHAVDVAGRVVIVVDDGIATGGTVRAALKGLARARPSGLCWPFRSPPPTPSSD